MFSSQQTSDVNRWTSCFNPAVQTEMNNPQITRRGPPVPRAKTSPLTDVRISNGNVNLPKTETSSRIHSRCEELSLVDPEVWSLPTAMDWSEGRYPVGHITSIFTESHPDNSKWTGLGERQSKTEWIRRNAPNRCCRVWWPIAIGNCWRKVMTKFALSIWYMRGGRCVCVYICIFIRRLGTVQ